jgi:hydroxymethylpyrimidine kinase/phosphomethylpyrimidine kinase
MNTVLAIGGWDPTSGAGITADVKAVHACGGYATTALTGLALQTPQKVLAVTPVPPALLRRTLSEALGGMPLGAVKTGMLATAAHARIAFDFVRERDVPWVFDPVRFASDGTLLGNADPKRALPRPGLAVITPNLLELAALTGLAVTTRKGREASLAALFAAGFDAVLVKGGHGRGATAGDELVLAGGPRFYHERRRYPGSLHGSGCTLAAALAAFLAAKAALPSAFYQAEMFMDAVFESAWDAGGRRRLSVLPQGAVVPAAPVRERRNSPFR